MGTWSDKKTLEEKITVVEANLASLETAIVNYADSGGVVTVSINGKSVTKSDFEALENLHGFYNKKLKAFKLAKRVEEGKSGQGFVQHRF